jgi:hypothetical protein
MRASDRPRVAEWKRELCGDEDGDGEDTIFVCEAHADTVGAFVSSGEPVPHADG